MVIDNKLNLGDTVCKLLKHGRKKYLQVSNVIGITINSNGIEYLTNPPMPLSDKEVGEIAFTSKTDWFDKAGDKIVCEWIVALYICDFIKCNTKWIFNAIEQAKQEFGSVRVDNKVVKVIKELNFNPSDIKISLIENNANKSISTEEFFNISKYLTITHSGVENNRYYFTLNHEDVKEMDFYVEIKEKNKND